MYAAIMPVRETMEPGEPMRTPRVDGAERGVDDWCDCIEQTLDTAVTSMIKMISIQFEKRSNQTVNSELVRTTIGVITGGTPFVETDVDLWMVTVE